MGSGGRPIAELVVKKLGGRWRLYHKDLIEKIAKEAKLEKKLIEEIDEKRRSTIEEITLDFFGKKYASLTTYYKSLVRVLTEIGQRGYGVIIGRGANFLFPHALNVRIICQMEQRIKWLMEFTKVSKLQAMERIAESDKKRGDFAQTLFHHDTKKAHHYDLIIRTGPELDIEIAADLIAAAAKKRFKL
jgi:cytidylate kinase